MRTTIFDGYNANTYLLPKWNRILFVDEVRFGLCSDVRVMRGYDTAKDLMCISCGVLIDTAKQSIMRWLMFAVTAKKCVSSCNRNPSRNKSQQTTNVWQLTQAAREKFMLDCDIPLPWQTAHSTTTRLLL